MIGVDQLMDVRDLNRQGHSIRAIARLTGLSRNTVRKALRGHHDLKRKESTRSSKLDPFKDYLRQRRGEHPLSAVRLLAEIQPMGYDGSAVTLRRFLAEFEDRDHRSRRLTVRFESPPGQQAQADWAYAGRLIDAAGQSRSVYIFVFVLAYSRMLFVHFTTSMNLASLILCHQRAFDYLGGWPRVILYDNMKQVRIGPGRWNEAFLDFANHHGFTPKTHRPYRPRTKGKVERAVEYVKDSFLLGRSFADMEDLNSQAIAWMEQTANSRMHATTRERPVDLFPREGLIPTAILPTYRFIDPVQRTVSFEAMVSFHGSRYSVPPAFAGKPVEVAALSGQIIIRAGDVIIAEHHQAARPGQCIADREHITELWKITDEQVRRPRTPCQPLLINPAVQRVDLRLYEEVLA